MFPLRSRGGRAFLVLCSSGSWRIRNTGTQELLKERETGTRERGNVKINFDVERGNAEGESKIEERWQTGRKEAFGYKNRIPCGHQIWIRCAKALFKCDTCFFTIGRSFPKKYLVILDQFKNNQKNKMV